MLYRIVPIATRPELALVTLSDGAGKDGNDMHTIVVNKQTGACAGELLTEAGTPVYKSTVFDDTCIYAVKRGNERQLYKTKYRIEQTDLTTVTRLIVLRGAGEKGLAVYNAAGLSEHVHGNSRGSVSSVHTAEATMATVRKLVSSGVELPVDTKVAINYMCQTFDLLSRPELTECRKRTLSAKLTNLYTEHVHKHVLTHAKTS
jgi:hypothetical protein